MGIPLRNSLARLCFLCLAPLTLTAQNNRVTLQAGSNLIVAGGNLVLNNTDFLGDGALDASNATVTVMSTSNTFFGGAGIPLIRVLTINTSPTTTLLLDNTVQITSALDFQNGLVDLNNQQLQLTGSAILQSETEAAHLTGISGGMVTATATAVSNPSQFNVGNLGASITSSANLGTLTVNRSHKPATNPGNSSLRGIQRTFLIQPQNNAALNATLRFYYLDAELNGDDPATLSLWKSSNGVNWAQVGADTRNTAGKYLEKAGLADFSYWTVTDMINPLPLTLLSFKATCEGAYAILQWQTGSESDIDRFVVERSSDGSTWLDIGETAAYNNPNGSSYTYKDPAPQASALYRLKILDLSGAASYSPIFRGGCSDIALPFLVYPNPTPGQATAQVSVREATSSILQLFNMTGQLLFNIEWNLQPGINQYILPVASLAAGTGNGATITNTNNTSTANTLQVTTNGPGVIADHSTGNAGNFFMNSTNGVGAGVRGEVNSLFGNNGTAGVYGVASGTGGYAGYFDHTETTGFGIAVQVVNHDLGTALVVDHEGTGNLAIFQVGGFDVARIDHSGRGFFNGGTQSSGADLAEAFAVEGNATAYEPGDVLLISTTSDRTVVKSNIPYSSLVAGVYATKPGVLLTESSIDNPLPGGVPMGVVGVIPTKVCDEGGPIHRGDILVTSSRPGYAMKADYNRLQPGQAIGKALEEFNGTTGKIRVLVNVR